MSYGQDFGIKRKNRKDRDLRRLRTGSPTQLQAVPQQQQQQRGAYRRPQPSGRVSTTEQPEQNGLLASANEGKAYVDNISGMYQTGELAGKGIDKGMDWAKEAWDGSALQNAMPDMSVSDYMPTGLSMPSFDMSMPDFLSGSATQASSIPLATDFSMVDGTINSLGGEFVGANSPFAGGDASGLLGDSTGAMADGATTTGLQGSGATLSQAMPYLNIGKDLIMGSDNLTGNQFGDAALRGGLAYATGGLSELGYAVGDMFDWW